MPGSPDGTELARAFRSRYPQKPVILISGYTAEDVGQEMSDDALLVRLAKPVRRDVLEKTIMHLLAGAEKS